jgi:hypothetical protein
MRNNHQYGAAHQPRPVPWHGQWYHAPADTHTPAVATFRRGTWRTHTDEPPSGRVRWRRAATGWPGVPAPFRRSNRTVAVVPDESPRQDQEVGSDRYASAGDRH